MSVKALLSRIRGASPIPRGDVSDTTGDLNDAVVSLYERLQPYTLTSVERFAALVEAIEYVSRHRIDGDIVECGVWRGGSMMAAADTLLRLGDTTRVLHLFDTYDGMTRPSAADVDWRDATAEDLLAQDTARTGVVWARASLDDVRANLELIGYPQGQVKFIQGPVEETVPAHAPEKIAVLRLDTDWYDSTAHELKHLYPRLSVGGVLLIDDYGHWKGARRAVDEYIAEHQLKLLLVRVDYTGRVAVKQVS